MSSPNILLIHTDQQATWTVGAHGGTEVATPHIDRIGTEGVVVDRCHTVSAVCTPSRGCLMSGLYPHQHEASANNIPLASDTVTWAEMLKRAGYRTGYVGKWHLDGSLRPGFVHPERGFGFDDNRFMFNRGHWKRMFDRPYVGEPGIDRAVAETAEEYTTDWLTTKAIEFIDPTATEPFALMLSIPDPHFPALVRPPFDTMFDPDSMPVPASWDGSELPSWADLNGNRYGERTPENIQRLQRRRAAYLGMVACIDENVGRLLDHLSATGLESSTLVVFTSDHGEYMGEHGLQGKNRMYRSVYEVPCVMRLPGRLPAGGRVQAMVTHNDFAPTICSLAGVAAPPRLGGRDLTPLLEGQAVAWRDEVYQHHNTFALAGLLTPEWHLVVHREGEHRLFNLVEDPDERSDRFADPTVAEIRGDLLQRIQAHHEDTASPAAPWLRGLVF